jgi:hypothetical protein
MFAVLLAQGLPGTGPAIMVSMCLALFGIVSFFLITYFAHSFLVVLIDSAAGIDVISWPSEAFAEWFTKPIYVLWVLLPLLGASAIVGAAAGPFAFGIALLVLLWLVSPVMFMSSLAAKSWGALLYGPFLSRWLRFSHGYLVFLLWSGVITALGAGLLVWSIRSLTGVFVSALFLPMLSLLYWRILGRYGWYITTRRMSKTKKKAKNPARDVKVESLDPWAMPAGERTVPLATEAEIDEPDNEVEAEVETGIRDLSGEAKPAAATDESIQPIEDEWTPNKKPYGVMTEPQARESWVERPRSKSDDDEGYEVEQVDQQISIGPPVSLFEYYAEREKKEEVLREQGKSVRQHIRPRKPPTLGEAMTKEIAGFLFYPHCLRTLINLAILFGVELMLLHFITQITGVIQSM